MSDIAINVHYSKDSAQRRSPGGNQKRRNQKRRNKGFRKKSRDLQQKGLLRPSGQDPPPHQRRQSFTNNRSSACPASASHCSQKPSSSADGLPSLTVAVNIREKPKEPVSKQPTSSGQRASASGSRKATATQTSAGLPTKYVAIDCEMVGTGPKGSISQLARCSLVSYDGDVLYDKFICPPTPVTDYRTRWSGIRRSDLANATPYSEARREILRLLMGKVVLGHAVHNDFKVLGYSHPSALTRDTSRIPLLNLKAGFDVNECASLKRLTKAIFNRDIQTGSKGHSSVEDARATMELYKVVEEEWERKLACRWKAS